MNPLRLVMIGDSITEWGRPAPTAPDYATALGHGYVALTAQQLTRRNPARRLEVINRGIGGNTVRDLAARWSRDVLDLSPDWLTVMIGINDVWRFFDPARRADAVPPAEYETTLDRLLAAARPRVRELVLLTPFYVEPNRAEPMRHRMDEFGAIVARLAPQHGARLIDTQAIIDRLLALHAPETIALDRVHIGDLGHTAFADAVCATLSAAS
ncbi:MAG: SGNH/GDSL hydrolase family protein [Candidatus Didemnitutus sp.]|nr:SGNH/GDSL hydrolase family protein [Candidatus Didemnitutus sp.]